MLRLTINVDSMSLTARVRAAVDGGIDQAVEQVVTTGMRAGLEAIIAQHPVRTGRSRGAWVTCLSQLGGESVGESADTAGEGIVTIDHAPGRTVVLATNTVPYEIYLEEGTSRHVAYAMVAESLPVAAEVVTAEWANTGWFGEG